VTETVEVTFTGNPHFAYALVACIKDAGGEVAWHPPFETRSAEHVAQEVVVGLIVGGSTASAGEAAKAGIAKFSARFAGRGKAVIEHGE
jgi:hypothetical protein